MSNKFPACDSCANQDTDPAICRRCDDADLFEPLDDNESADFEVVSLHELDRMFNRSR